MMKKTDAAEKKTEDIETKEKFNGKQKREYLEKNTFLTNKEPEKLLFHYHKKVKKELNSLIIQFEKNNLRKKEDIKTNHQQFN
jgi:hypothetical protein